LISNFPTYIKTKHDLLNTLTASGKRELLNLTIMKIMNLDPNSSGTGLTGENWDTRCGSS
jgi:hypothetical protein